MLKHLVIFMVAVLHWLIPDVPDEIKSQIERENFIKQRLVWEADDSVTKNLLDVNKSEEPKCDYNTDDEIHQCRR
jgi:hypothetical protein